MNWVCVTQMQGIPLREGRRVRYGDQEVALFNLGDEYRAVDNQCPHRQGPLADGIVAGRAVFCPLHNLKVSLENSCVLAGGSGQVRTYPVRIEDGKIFIDFDAATLAPQQHGCDTVAAQAAAPDVN